MCGVNEKHNENALDLCVPYPGQKKGEGKEENMHYFDIFKYQALSVITYIIFFTVFWGRINLDTQSTDEETEFQRNQVCFSQGNWEVVETIQMQPSINFFPNTLLAYESGIKYLKSINKVYVFSLTKVICSWR